MIRGERVLLRPVKKEDIAVQHEFNQDISIQVLNGSFPHVSPLERAQEFYENCTKRDESSETFAMEVDGKYIGSCSLRWGKNYPGSYHLGIIIGDRDLWGKGYGREAVALLLHHCFHYYGARRIGLITNAKNERAIGCFLACGFIEEGRIRKIKWIDGEFTDLVQMGMLREEWDLLKSQE